MGFTMMYPWKGCGPYDREYIYNMINDNTNIGSRKVMIILVINHQLGLTKISWEYMDWTWI